MRRLFLGGVATAAVAAGVASAWAQVIEQPDWLRRPSSQAIANYYPDEATDRTISGKATVTCSVTTSGMLENCTAVDERPAGLGFGEAAIRMAVREFRMKPKTVDGRPVVGEVTIPIVFLMGSGIRRYIILDPIWAEAPTFEDMAAVWPTEVGDLPSGTAALRCNLSATGSLRVCEIAGGIPKESVSQFGRAALKLAPRFRVRLSPQEAEKYKDSDVIVSFRFLNPATPAGQARKVVRPEWISRIDAAKVVALFPNEAADNGVKSGVGVADCLVAADGKLTDCRPGREDPAGLGFAAAAVAVAQFTQMNPWTPEGRPVQGARVRLPVTFNLASEPAAPPPPAAN